MEDDGRILSEAIFLMEIFHSAHINLCPRLNKRNYRAHKLILCRVHFDG
jgi:hypothetical protein